MTLKDIKDILSPIFERYKDHIAFAYLFGSAALGSLTPLSDIDIAVYLYGKERKAYYDTGLSLHADICRALKKNDVDLVILNTVKNIILLDEIARNSIVLFDKDKNLREDFEHRVLHRAIDFKEQRKAIIGI